MVEHVRLQGVILVLPTPFGPNGEVRPDEVRRAVAWALDKGADGVTVLGVAGEVFRLSDDERASVVAAAVDAAAGRIPVVSGAGHMSTPLAVNAARVAVAAGASALLLPPPPVGKATSAAVVEYYDAVATAVDVPIVLQDDPVHLGVGLSLSTIVQLWKAHPNCAYAKLEELPSMPKIKAVVDATGGQIACLGGSGGVYVLEELAAGATGIMTGFAYPEALVAVFAAWQAGDRERARLLFRVVGDLARLEALPGVSLSIRKRLYQARGVLSNPALRPPAVEVDEFTWSLAEAELRRVDAEWAALHEG